jgi:hypothetical protein
MIDQAMWHEAQLELEHMLSDALYRAESGWATPEDWNIIRRACGLMTHEPRVVKFNEDIGDNYEFSS